VQTHQSRSGTLPDDTRFKPTKPQILRRHVRNSPLKTWFDRLASGKGLCCSFADGATVRL